jgi:hypothetical protein
MDHLGVSARYLVASAASASTVWVYPDTGAQVAVTGAAMTRVGLTELPGPFPVPSRCSGTGHLRHETPSDA